MSSGRKHTDKSSKSTEAKHGDKKHKKEVKAPVITTTQPVTPKPLQKRTVNGKIVDILARLSFMHDDYFKDFSPEYCERQQELVQTLEKQLNEKLNNNLEKVYVVIEKSLVMPVLPDQIKTRLTETQSVIITVIDKKTLSERVNELALKVQVLLKHQQDVAQLQVDIASLPASCAEKDKFMVTNSRQINLDAGTLSILAGALEKNTKILKLINNINACLNPSVYAPGSPALSAAKPEPVKQQTVKPEGITTGPVKK